MLQFMTLLVLIKIKKKLLIDILIIVYLLLKCLENVMDLNLNYVLHIMDVLNDSIIHESTAKGAFGAFYRMWRAAERGDADQNLLPFFAPWFWDERYVGSFYSSDHRNEFMKRLEPEDVEYGQRFGLSPERLLWMVTTRARACGSSRKRFNQEYPADSKMAFIATGDTAFDQDRLAVLAELAKPPQWYGTIALT